MKSFLKMTEPSKILRNRILQYKQFAEYYKNHLTHSKMKRAALIIIVLRICNILILRFS